jgi:hypothetical protein
LAAAKEEGVSEERLETDHAVRSTAAATAMPLQYRTVRALRDIILG